MVKSVNVAGSRFMRLKNAEEKASFWSACGNALRSMSSLTNRFVIRKSTICEGRGGKLLMGGSSSKLPMRCKADSEVGSAATSVFSKVPADKSFKVCKSSEQGHLGKLRNCRRLASSNVRLGASNSGEIEIGSSSRSAVSAGYVPPNMSLVHSFSLLFGPGKVDMEIEVRWKGRGLIGTLVGWTAGS